MDNLYTIRKANLQDVAFLADVIIGAEKSNSDKLSFSTLFNIEEEKVKELLCEMLDEEIIGCELSISSFLIVDFRQKPVAAFGGWVEGLEEEMSSKILKSNLLSYYFGREGILHLKTKAHLIKDILIDRADKNLQLEYLYIDKEHRGKKITDLLISQHILNAKLAYPELKKVQVQVFKNNIGAIKVYEKSGFTISKSFKVKDDEVLNYLPFNEKYLMEKTIHN